MIARIQGVKRVRSKGREYFYHRKTMTPLPGKPGSAEFLSRLRVLDARAEAAVPRSLGMLIDAYRASPEFSDLAAGSKGVYDLVFNPAAAELASAGRGDRRRHDLRVARQARGRAHMVVRQLHGQGAAAAVQVGQQARPLQRKPRP